jgi:hypothetical protein
MFSDDLFVAMKKARDAGLKQLTLTIERKHPPRGEGVRTPFGVCEIANVVELESGKFRIVFWADLEKMFQVIRQAGVPI